MSFRLRTRVERLEARRPPETGPRLILIRGVKPGDPAPLMSWIEADGHRYERTVDEAEEEFRDRVERAVPPGRVWIGSGG